MAWQQQTLGSRLTRSKQGDEGLLAVFREQHGGQPEQLKAPA